MGRLQQRVAIVTGGGQGVGLGVVRAFAAEGAHVVIANRTRETGEAAVATVERDFGNAGGSVRFVATDVADEPAVRDLVRSTAAQLGRIDILVNNATPATGAARLEEMAMDAMEQQVRVNYYAAFWAMQESFPHMKAAGYGRIINMCSLNGINAHLYTAMYNGAKEALRALTRTAAVEWGRYGITSNAICPAAVTPAWEMFQKFDPHSARAILAAHPMRRLGDAEADVGPLAVFLASEESRYINGNTVHADGGGHVNGTPWHPELPE